MGKLLLIMSNLSVLAVLITVVLNLISQDGKLAVQALPLQTKSRWIVDEAGNRVKLACVNWVSHLNTGVAEGLSKSPLDTISNRIVSMGFNCVRLTWPLYLVTNDTFASLKVRESFERLGLTESIAGIQANNPSILELSLIEAFQTVVAALGNNNVMVILDNHMTTPEWCCSNNDGNGFFGDKYFDPNVWIQGLTNMASIFNGVTNVIGLSLRNELRGPRQNVNDWYRYMQQGAEAVHAANPDVLVVLSGLYFDKDLSFLNNREVELTFNGKLVFEAHWYAFTDGSAWESGNPNQACAQVTRNVMRMSGFLLEKGWPLFFSEFGIDTRGTNVNDNRYLGCFMALAAELDVDWALWTLVGSYYLRQGVVGLNEYYGILNWNWCDIRNESYIQRISVLQQPFQGPGLSEMKPHKVLFHPQTGLCVLRRMPLGPLTLGPCTMSEAWTYTPQKILTLKGTYFCIQACGSGEQATLGIVCSNDYSKWEQVSASKLHLSATAMDGSAVCLDVDDDNNIITTSCKCLSGDNQCDPESQWFKLVDSTRCPQIPIKAYSEVYSIVELPAKASM